MNAGTLIHGTLLNYDLLDAFVTELEQVSVGDDDRELTELISRANALCADGCRNGRDFVNYADGDYGDAVIYIIDQLMCTLDEYAPAGLYFGANEGDGADFGYWPIDED